MGGWSVTQQMIILNSILLKKLQIENQSSSSQCRFLIWLSYITFHVLPNCLQRLCEIDSESCQTQFTRLCALPSEVNVLFDWNLSRLNQICCFAQHSIQNMWICSCSLFLLRDQLCTCHSAICADLCRQRSGMCIKIYATKL